MFSMPYMERTQELIPGEQLAADRMPGHWLLARLGKKVLRPGGRELTDKLLAALDIGSSDRVVELAPGLGSTTELVLGRNPYSYVGVDRDPVSTERVAHIVTGPRREVRNASATDTGLEDRSATVAFGEAYLTMQPDSQKRRIVDELARVVEPGGRVGMHEVAFKADVDDATRSDVAAQLQGSIKVNVSPLSLADWQSLFSDAGFEVDQSFTAPLHLLEPKRLVADEGLLGAARFASRVLRDGDARRRVLAMRRAMSGNSETLEACAFTAIRRPAPGAA